MSETMQVEVAYARPDEQVIVSVEVAAACTIGEAIERSGIQARFPELAADGVSKVGVFGKLAKLDGTLSPGDRVEIYRPLIADPKEARKRRAAEGKDMKKGAREEGV